MIHRLRLPALLQLLRIHSHVVLGAARLFGLQLHENFNRPYLSNTISEFWTRWHMSLSFWIRDFLFLPLATMRREAVVAQLVAGDRHVHLRRLAHWHAGTTGNVLLLLIWGIYHGLLMVLHRQWQELCKRTGFKWSGALATAISWWLTFSAICIGYIFFRAESVHQAFAMLKAMASLHTYRHLTLDHSFYVMTFVAAA
jgi:alginate O-acetyltransferase complex protein AlgI